MGDGDCQGRKVAYIDLNNLVATEYEKLGPEYVGPKLFIEDHTHTTKEGGAAECKARG